MSGSQLISVTELTALLSDPKLVLLDVRYSLTDAAYGRAAYAEGHIPGARFADLKADVAGVCSGSNGRTPLPDSGRFCVNMRRLGLNPDSTVIVYDDGESNFAARLWFTLRWVGFANVRVLNGGLCAWNAIWSFATTRSSTRALTTAIRAKSKTTIRKRDTFRAASTVRAAITSSPTSALKTRKRFVENLRRSLTVFLTPTSSTAAARA